MGARCCLLAGLLACLLAALLLLPAVAAAAAAATWCLLPAVCDTSVIIYRRAALPGLAGLPLSLFVFCRLLVVRRKGRGGGNSDLSLWVLGGVCVCVSSRVMLMDEERMMIHMMPWLALSYYVCIYIYLYVRACELTNNVEKYIFTL